MTTNTKSNISKIGWYQIIGGGVGFLIILFSLLATDQLQALTILVYGFMLLFFMYSIICGILCVKHTSNALTHSIINQFLQLVSFAFLGYSFFYVAGLYLYVGLDLSNSFEIKFGLGISSFSFNINREQERTEVNIN